MNYFAIRSGENHFDADGLFLSKSLIAMGWPDAGNLDMIAQNERMYRSHLEATHLRYPEVTSRRLDVGAKALIRFRNVAKVNDIVLYERKHDDRVHIGVITGNYEFRPEFAVLCPHVRKVEWIKSFWKNDFLLRNGTKLLLARGLTFNEVEVNFDVTK